MYLSQQLFTNVLINLILFFFCFAFCVGILLFYEKITHKVKGNFVLIFYVVRRVYVLLFSFSFSDKSNSINQYFWLLGSFNPLDYSVNQHQSLFQLPNFSTFTLAGRHRVEVSAPLFFLVFFV